MKWVRVIGVDAAVENDGALGSTDMAAGGERARANTTLAAKFPALYAAILHGSLCGRGLIRAYWCVHRVSACIASVEVC